jgi:hypothetical protein
MSEGVDLSRRRFVGVTAMTIAGAHFNGTPSAVARSELSALAGATAWLNSEPLTSTGLHGKVVLVHFSRYPCIDWRRQLPYVRAWAEKICTTWVGRDRRPFARVLL